MAKGRKTGGRDIKKGQVLNPNGRPKLTTEQYIFAHMTKSELLALLTKIWKMPVEELQQLAGTPGIPSGEAMTINVVCKIIEEGDVDGWEKLLQRIFGKVPDKLESKNETTHLVKEMPTQELVEAGLEAIAFLNANVLGEKQ